MEKDAWDDFLPLVDACPQNMPIEIRSEMGALRVMLRPTEYDYKSLEDASEMLSGEGDGDIINVISEWPVGKELARILDLAMKAKARIGFDGEDDEEEE
eukprot:427725-Pyramimonas_sp.AAC.1